MKELNCLERTMDIAEYKALMDKPKGSKFKAKPTVYNGVRYPSKKHAKAAADLDFRIKVGIVVSWIREVPFPLPGKTATGRPIKHFVDFLAFKPDGTYQLIEVKGFRVGLGELKRSQVEELYNVVIEVW